MVTAIGFEGLAVPTVLPAALDEFGGLPLYGWAFSGFLLASLVGITVAGSQADRRGPLPPFAAGVLLFAAGLLIAGPRAGHGAGSWPDAWCRAWAPARSRPSST